MRIKGEALPVGKTKLRAKRSEEYTAEGGARLSGTPGWSTADGSRWIFLYFYRCRPYNIVTIGLIYHYHSIRHSHTGPTITFVITVT